MKMWVVQVYLFLTLLLTIRFCASKPMKEPFEEPQELQIYEAVGIEQSTGRWTSVPRTSIGSSQLRKTGTLTFTIPSVIPSTANEVLVLIDAEWGTSGPNAGSYVKIYTQESNKHYEKYISLRTYNQDAWGSNTDNAWFPMSSTRKIFAEVTKALTGNVELRLYAIGYR